MDNLKTFVRSISMCLKTEVKDVKKQINGVLRKGRKQLQLGISTPSFQYSKSILFLIL